MAFPFIAIATAAAIVISAFVKPEPASKVLKRKKRRKK